MAIIKHNSRTLREKDKSPKSCRNCGEVGFYWAHDTSIWAPTCDDPKTGCGANGKWVLINANATTRAIAVGDPVDIADVHNVTCTNSRPVKSEPVVNGWVCNGCGDRRQDKPGTDGKCPLCTTDDATVKPSQSPAKPVEPVPAPITPAPASAPSPSVSASSTDMFAGFLTAVKQEVAAGLASTVDAAQVDAMIAARMDALSLPTQLTVNSPSGSSVTITGAHNQLPTVIKVVARNKNLMMVGPAGTGKSHIARQAAEALELRFASVACHPLLTDVRLLGFRDAHGVFHSTPFMDMWENGGLFLIDEIDNCHPSILCALNEALANGETAFGDGRMVKRHPDFRCIGAANTFGRGATKQYVGRQAIDAATLDRFFVLSIDYDETMEEMMCLATGADKATVKKVLRYARKLRSNVFAKDMRAVVSVRGTSTVCDMMADGMSWDDAFEGAIFKGMSANDRITIGA